MSKRDREKLNKTKARKAKRAVARKAALTEARENDPEKDQGQDTQNRPFGVDSVGRSVGGGAPRMPRRSKKG